MDEAVAAVAIRYDAENSGPDPIRSIHACARECDGTYRRTGGWPQTLRGIFSEIDDGETGLAFWFRDREKAMEFIRCTWTYMTVWENKDRPFVIQFAEFGTFGSRIIRDEK